MLFKENLESLIFTRHEKFDVDQLVIVSGYLGPNPIKDLNKIPLDCKVIFGMYGDQNCVKSALHDQMIKYQTSYDNLNIYYSKSPVHAKAYLWLKNNNPITALIGSANFSNNGLNTPWKEILAEATTDTFDELLSYKNKIIDDSLLCTSDSVRICKKKTKRDSDNADLEFDPKVCVISLLANGIVPEKSGLNWGFGQGHNSHGASEIRIRVDHIRKYQHFFPRKKEYPIGHKSDHKDQIEIIWDDGISMKALMEQTLPVKINGYKILFPKAICSAKNKNILGEYLRKRLGLSEKAFVTIDHLNSYGRTDISVSLIGEGIYYFDFSV